MIMGGGDNPEFNGGGTFPDQPRTTRLHLNEDLSSQQDQAFRGSQGALPP